MGVMDPLHEEHGELLPHVEALRAAGEMVGRADLPQVVAAVDESLQFLRADLIPHAHSEDAVLYPVVERVMQAPGATSTMRRDHEEVVRLTDALARVRDEFAYGEPSPGDLGVLQRLLYSLYAVVSLHFAKEEEVYLPQLEAALTRSEAEELFEKMRQAAARVDHRGHAVAT